MSPTPETTSPTLLLTFQEQSTVTYLPLCMRRFLQNTRKLLETTPCGLNLFRSPMKFPVSMDTKVDGNSLLASKLLQVVKLALTNMCWMTILTAVYWTLKFANLVNPISLSLLNVKTGINQGLKLVIKMLKDSKFPSSSVNSEPVWPKAPAHKKLMLLPTPLTNTSLDGLTGNSNSTRIWQLQLEQDLKDSTTKLELYKLGK